MLNLNWLAIFIASFAGDCRLYTYNPTKMVDCIDGYLPRPHSSSFTSSSSSVLSPSTSGAACSLPISAIPFLTIELIIS